MPEVDGSYLVARTLKEENTDCLFYLMGGPNYEIINNSEDAAYLITGPENQGYANISEINLIKNELELYLNKESKNKYDVSSLGWNIQ